MVRVSIGDYRVEEGETLPTVNLNDEYEIAWDRDSEKLYSVIVLDEGSVKKSSPEKSVIHLLWTNITDWEEVNVVADYLPPIAYPKPHKYSVYIFEQSCNLYPNIQSRENFNLKEFLKEETDKNCELNLVDYLSFYGVADPMFIESEDTSEEEMRDIFSEMYDVEKMGEEDYRILAASVYGISKPEKMTTSQIIEKINKILLYRGSV